MKRLIVVLLALTLAPGCTGSKANLDKRVGQKAKMAMADVVPAEVPSRGVRDALVTIVEISDFQCPFCSRVGPTIKKILAAYPKDVRIVWSNNALSFHNRARPAAIAALAAHRQGKFWPYHDKLFANQRSLTDENLKKWAGEVGLDVAKWSTDIKDKALAKQVEQEQAAAVAVGARGIPGFFINGKLLSGAQPFELFKIEIDEALVIAKKHKAAGKTGMALIDAAWGERDAEKGKRVAAYFLKREAPPKKATQPKKSAKLPPMSDVRRKMPVSATDHSLGDASKAQVTIVAFSDLQCPFCSRGKNTIDQVRKHYGDKVRIIFKHFPLPFHNQAGPAHKAAIAAGNQGKFWQFHDMVFANQRKLSDESLVTWARELGLDMVRFNADRQAQAAANRIKADKKLAAKLGIRGTPNFLINGRKLMGAQPFGVFKVLIDEEIAKAGKATLKGQAYYDSLIAKGKIFTALDTKVHKLDVTNLPYKGDKDAGIAIVMFCGFQCPYSRRVCPLFAKVPDRFPGRVKVVFAHFPLSFHKQGLPASVLGQAAFEQGGPDLFWKVHDQLFFSQRELSTGKLGDIGRAAGVDLGKMEANQARHEKVIDASRATGSKAGVRGTPTVYINGRKYQPTTGFSAKAIDEIIRRLLAGGP